MHVIVFIVMAVLLRARVIRGDVGDMSAFSFDGDGFDDMSALLTSSMFDMPTTMTSVVKSTKQEHFTKLTGKEQPHFTELCSKLMTSGGWGYYPVPGSCNQYIHCDKQSHGYLESCAVGTFFNGQKCMRAEDVDCFFDPCRQLPTGHRYSDGQTCYGFYKCLHGKSVQGSCPAVSSFNAMKQDCLPDHTCVQITSIQHPCSAGTTMPFPGQPHMFYLWDGLESVTEMTCPNGLWYNPRVCACDWVVPGMQATDACLPMFHFGYNGNFLEEFNKAPQAPNPAVSLYKNSALFGEGGQIVIWMMNDIDMNSDWALCFEFMSHAFGEEIALVSNDWQKTAFTYKLTYLPAQHAVRAYFRMVDGSVTELLVMGVSPHVPHFVRVARVGSMMKLRVDNIPTAVVVTDTGVASAPVPMVIGSANGCEGFVGFFDELKYFRCVPKTFFGDYKR